MKTYKNTQYGILFSLFFLILIPLLIYSSFYKIGSKPIPILVTIIISILFLVIILIFYKLTITIDAKKFEVKLGIGILSKSVNLQDIDLSTIKNIKMPWYYGIGIRLTPKGWLWNIKFGNAIYFKTKKNVTFLIGTNQTKEIIKSIKAHL